MTSRRSTPFRWLTAAVAAIAAVSAVLYFYFRPTGYESEIAAKRAANRASFASGQSLPGTPDLARLNDRLSTAGVALGAPIFIRIFKREFELEVWLKRGERFERLDVYPICYWSGRLGPKIKEGDRQAPEGFYTVDALALNPNSHWHRSFNLGFPNAFDRAHGRTGSFLMVHGGCSSVGCYAMTDPVIDEIWRLVTAALSGGQKRFHVHVFPFRMTPEAMAAAPAQADGADELRNALRAGYEAFEATRQVPDVLVCDRKYMVNPKWRDGIVAAKLDPERACPL